MSELRSVQSHTQYSHGDARLPGASLLTRSWIDVLARGVTDPCVLSSLHSLQGRRSLPVLSGSKILPDGQCGATAKTAKDSEAYQYVGENSKVHFEMRTQGALRDQGKLEAIALALVLVVGIVLAMLSTATVVISGFLRLAREDVVEGAMHGDAATGTVDAYLRFLSISLGLVLVAALLTAWAPAAAGSGLPQLKAFLNGCHAPQILLPSTLIAKAIGTTLVITSGLPIGREGPMVAIGAALAACISSARCPLTHLLFEMRSPAAQRNWAGVGAAAGVAAAFNAPLGGILYSFEEVCCHWSGRMTWLSFVCSVTVVAAFDLLNDASDGFLTAGSLVDAKNEDPGVKPLRASFIRGDFIWVLLLGAAGGIFGSWYNMIGFRLARSRGRFYTTWFPKHAKIARLFEVAIIGGLAFSLVFWAPVMSGCIACPSAETPGCSVAAPNAITEAVTHGSVGDGSASHGSGDDYLHAIHVRLHSLRYRRWHCPEGQYSELATLLHAGQEELVKHLLSRGAEGPPPSLSVLLFFVPLYFGIAAVVLGLAVPAGNFIPALTLGAALGRVEALMLLDAGVIHEQDVGRYALVGAAATLGGVTRMTVTIAVILAEVTDDVTTLPVCMLALAVARVVGNRCALSFDHGMIEIMSVPYLRESPPSVFEVLTAKDVMAPRPVRLLEVTTVRDVLLVLTTSSHNGFPIMSGSCLSSRVKEDGTLASSCLCGLILRRQLLVLLREKVWNMQMHGMPLEPATKERFLSSFFVMAQVKLEAETMRVKEGLSAADLDAPLDLRSFYDPAPFAVNSLAPLSVVYRLFNEIGVRHIPVLSADQTLVGIITRKDVQPETISQRLSAVEVQAWATDMHRYWRSMLFGSQSADHGERSRRTSEAMSGDPASESAPRSKVRRMRNSVLSLGRRSSNSTATACPGGNRDSACSSRSAAPSSSGRRRGLNDAPVGTRRGSSDVRRGSNDARRGSVALLRTSAQHMGIRTSAQLVGPLPDRNSSPSNKRSSSPCSSDVSFGASPPLRKSGQPRISVELRKSGQRAQHKESLAKSLILVAEDMSPASQRSGKQSPVRDAGSNASHVSSVIQSQQPSLQASLRAATSRRLRESHYSTHAEPVLSLADVLSRPPSSNKSGERSTPQRVSKHLWQFGHRPGVQRRESAPAKMLSIQFQSLHAVCEHNH